MSDSQELDQWLKQRRQADADIPSIDAAIDARFGCVRAVMFTDLVGFSRRVDEFGILHFLQLIQESEEIFLPLISQHNGQCLKREGDSLLAVFDTAASALAAAHAMVAATESLNPPRAPEDQIEVCIGLGYGRVLRIDQNEVWGAQVNAASKLGEETAHGGEILATEDFRLAVPDEAFMEHGVLFGTRPAYRWMGASSIEPPHLAGTNHRQHTGSQAGPENGSQPEV
jgi:adenylate cyclase